MALPIFVQPILDLIHAGTNMQATFIVGGPEPADGGRLNIIRYVRAFNASVLGADFTAFFYLACMLAPSKGR
jgi:hypothetical protein